MTQEEVNLEAGLNQKLIGNKYKTDTNEILIVKSVMIWHEGSSGWFANAFLI